jgi:hypothetical protein
MNRGRATHRSWYPSADQLNQEEVSPAPIQPSVGDGESGIASCSLAEREEGVMMKRLEVWVQRRLTSLPKSKSTLLRALRTDLCSLRRQVYTPDAALARLVREGFIELISDTNATIEPEGRRGHKLERPPSSPPAPPAPSARRSEIAFHASPAIKEVVVDGDGDGEESDEAKEMAMRKMKQWVERQEAHPKMSPATVEATKRALGQLCLVDVGFRPERLVELLEAKHYLRLTKDEDEDKDAVVWLLLDEREKEVKRKDDHQEDEKEEEKRKTKKKRL